MKIKVINPNTSASMTAAIGRAAREVAAPTTVVDAVHPAMGPVAVESHYDEALSVPGLLAEIAAGERDGFDGYVIACFGDPGLDAARELAGGPVVGIAEAAMRTATHLGRAFSVVTTLARTRGRAWDLVERYGVTRFCHAVHACDIPPLGLETDAAAKTLTEACRVAADEGVDAIVLGCAGMADLRAAVSAEVGVPVVDGVQAATLLVESLVTMGLRTGDRAEFAAPPAKLFTGILRDFGTTP